MLPENCTPDQIRWAGIISTINDGLTFDQTVRFGKFSLLATRSDVITDTLYLTTTLVNMLSPKIISNLGANSTEDLVGALRWAAAVTNGLMYEHDPEGHSGFYAIFDWPNLNPCPELPVLIQPPTVLP